MYRCAQLISAKLSLSNCNGLVGEALAGGSAMSKMARLEMLANPTENQLELAAWRKAFSVLI